MPTLLLVLLVLLSDLFKGTSTIEMDCMAVDQVYDRIKDSIRSTPMYQILRNKDTALCYRTRDESSASYVVFSPTCCTFDKEMALALTSSTLFRKYLYTESLQGYKYALDDIMLHYKGEIGKVLDPDLRDFIIDSIQRHGGEKSTVKEIMKEQLRIYLERKEQVNIPYISDSCYLTAERFVYTFTKYIDDYLGRLTALQEGIYLAIKLMDALQNQKVSPKCVEAVTRSSVMTIGCNQCDSSSATFKTCRSLCANVVNGCMKPLLPLLPIWFEWLKTMDSLDFYFNKEKEDLVNKKVTQKLFDSFSVDYHNLSDKCSINRSSSNVITRKSRDYWRVSDGGTVDTHPLYQDMFRSMFDDLQAKFCRELDLSAEDDFGPCWNGTHVGNYTGNLTYFNKESQERNQEVTDNSFIHFTAQRATTDLKNFSLKYKSQNDVQIQIQGNANLTTPPKPPKVNVTPTAAVASQSNHDLQPPQIYVVFLLVFSVHLYCRHRWLAVSLF